MIKDDKEVDATAEPVVAVDSTVETVALAKTDTNCKSRYIGRQQRNNSNTPTSQLQLRLFHQCLQIEALEKELKNSKSRTCELEIQVGDLKAKLKRQNVHFALLLAEMNLGEQIIDYQGHVEKLLRLENKALMGDHTEDAYESVQFLDDTMLRLKVSLISERRKMESERIKWKEEKDKLEKKHCSERNELTNKYSRLEMTHKNHRAIWDSERAQLKRQLTWKMQKSVAEPGQKMSNLTNGNSDNRLRTNSKNNTGRTITGISPWALMKALREADLNRNTSSARDLRRI